MDFFAPVGPIFLAPEIASFLFHIGAVGIHLSEYIIGLLSTIPFSTLRLAQPSLYEIVLYYILIISLLSFRRHHLFRVLCLCSIAGLLAIPSYAKIKKSTQKYESISFLDVGHGNCTIIELSNGDTVLVDGGGTSSEKFNIGEMIIAPFLWEKRIQKVNDVIISHSDADHYNGIRFILRHFSPDTLWVNSLEHGDEKFQELLDEADRLHIKICIPNTGEPIVTHDNVRIENIASLHLAKGRGKDNNKSLVIKVSNGETAVLLPGDIEKNAEQELLDRGTNLNATVLLAPHHGSPSSSSDAFVQAVSPEYIVISAGKFRKERFPAPEVLNRYRKLGTVFNTAIRGTVTFKISGGQLQIETFNSRKKTEIPPGRT